jgi:hypothetical protein
VEYQQGSLTGYEMKEYLLERDGRQCAYCKGKNVPFAIEHITPRSRGGSNRLLNLTLACTPCLRRKGNQTAAEYGYAEVHKQGKKTLRDAAVVNATRRRLYEDLQNTGLMVECGTGARTKYNRMQRGLSKEYFYEACCVGASTPGRLDFRTTYIFVWSATGRGNRQICQPDKFGFPRQHRSRNKFSFGFMTGDLVRARQPKSGAVVVGRLGAARADGSFYITLPDKKRFSFTYRNCQLLQRADGWQYQRKRIS